MKLLRIAAVVLAAYLAALIVLGFALAGRTTDRVAGRFAESLQATVTIGDSSLSLVRGGFTFEGLRVRRHDAIGELALDVGAVDCDLLPLGLAFVDRSCGDLAVRDVRLEISTLALFRVPRPKRRPFTAERILIERADLAFAPSTFFPGLGQIRIHIEHAEAGPTTFKTPLSWLFAVEALRATIHLPAGITLRLAYAGGRLAAAGSLFGSTPVEVPVRLPARDEADDARAELAKLVAFAKDVAERLVAQKAEDWLRQRLPVP